MDTGHGLESQTALINKLFIFPNYVNHLAGWVVTLSIEAAGLIPVDHVEVEKSESHSDTLLRWDTVTITVVFNLFYTLKWAWQTPPPPLKNKYAERSVVSISVKSKRNCRDSGKK